MAAPEAARPIGSPRPPRRTRRVRGNAVRGQTAEPLSTRGRPLSRLRADLCDNTMTTNVMCATPRSSAVANEVCRSPWYGPNVHTAGKVEGLVLLMRGGSSSLPGRIERACKRRPILVFVSSREGGRALLWQRIDNSVRRPRHKRAPRILGWVLPRFIACEDDTAEDGTGTPSRWPAGNSTTTAR